jgi:transposase
MLYAGLDLSRKRLDFHLLDAKGATVALGAAPPDADGLRGLSQRLERHGEPIRAAIESMNGARFVHDRLELAGWLVEIADAQKVKGLAPLACKTDRIDAWVLAELARRDLVPAIWLPDPLVRAERERARWRLHLVRHRSSLKQRVHAVLLTHGKPCPVSDLSGVRGRQLLARLDLPEPWQGTIEASLRLIDALDREIGECERELRRLGADHRYVPLLCTVPGISWVLAYTIAAELGDISRFPSPRKLAGYSGLCPRVYQSGERDLRGPLAKQGPRYLRWALVEAATHACTHPIYRSRYQQTKARIGKQRGAKVAQVDLARRLAEAIWHMLTRNQPFAPFSAPVDAGSLPLPPSELYVIDADGSGRNRVAHCDHPPSVASIRRGEELGCIVRAFSWSPDGKRLAFVQGTWAAA